MKLPLSETPKTGLVASRPICEHLWSFQGLYRLEKNLNVKDFTEKSLKIKSALKNAGESLFRP